MELPEVKTISAASLYTKQYIEEMETGNKYIVRYTCDTNVVYDTSTFPSDINISFNLYKVNSAGVFTGDSYCGVGSGFYKPAGGEVEIIIPENAETGLYKLVSFIDYGNFYSISNKYTQTPIQNPHIVNISDTIIIVNNSNTLIEISKFELESRTSYYSFNDYDLLKAKHNSNASTIFDSTSIRAAKIDNYVYISNDTGASETLPASALPALTPHLKVNANIVLRGEAASVDSYTFVNFYLEPWFAEQGGSYYENFAQDFRTNPVVLDWVDTFNAMHPDDPINSPDSLWFDIFIINHAKNTGLNDSSVLQNMLNDTEKLNSSPYDQLPAAAKNRITRDTTLTEQLLEYYPVSFAKDTMPHQDISLTLDLWIPETTALFIRDMYRVFNKSVWRIAMDVFNEGVNATMPASWNDAEPFRALSYTRFVEITSTDLFPDGSRQVSRYDYYNDNGKYYRNLKNWSLKQWGDYFGIWAGYMSDKYMRQTGAGLETSNLFLTTKVFGNEIIIFEQENEACADIKNISKSYLAKKMVLLNFTVSSKTVELGNNVKVDFSDPPKSKINLTNEAKDKIKDKLKEMFTRKEKKPEKDSDKKEDKFSKKFVEANCTFWIWFVPFTVAGDITGKVGMTYAKQIIRCPAAANDYSKTINIGGAPIESLDLVLDTIYSWDFKNNDIVYIVGVLEPYGEISGNLRGGLGGWFGGFGVGGELQLIKIGIPIDYGAGYQKTTSPTNEFVRFDTVGIGISLYSGSGRLYVWGRVLWVYGEITVANWYGWWSYSPLFRANWGSNTLQYF